MFNCEIFRAKSGSTVGSGPFAKITGKTHYDPTAEHLLGTLWYQPNKSKKVQGKF